MDRLRLGLPGREEELETVLELLRNMGRLGIEVLCYNWMAVVPWSRTSSSVPTRGGATATGFDLSTWADGPDAPEAPVPEERLWESLGWFLERAVPVAEEAGVRLALHPDDPPLSPLRGHRPDRSLPGRIRPRLRAPAQPGERDDTVPGQRSADDRRPPVRDPALRARGADPLRALPRRSRHAGAIRRDVRRRGADRHGRVCPGLPRRRRRRATPNRSFARADGRRLGSCRAIRRSRGSTPSGTSRGSSRRSAARKRRRGDRALLRLR